MNGVARAGAMLVDVHLPGMGPAAFEAIRGIMRGFGIEAIDIPPTKRPRAKIAASQPKPNEIQLGNGVSYLPPPRGRK